MIQRTILTAVASALLWVAAPAQAVPVTQSTSVFLTFRDCVNLGTTACDGISPIQASSIDGLPGASAASALQADPRGSADASAQLLAGGSATLIGNALSNPLARNSTNSYSLQRYSYAGSQAGTLTLSALFNYSQTVPAENAAFPQNGATSSLANGYIEIFTVTGSTIEAGATATDNFNMLSGGWMSEPGYLQLGFDTFSSLGVTGTGLQSLSASVNLNPGDDVWLYTRMQTPAVNGAEVHASLSSSVTLTAVPEPGTLALVALSLVGLGLAGRRRH